ncbi:MAG: glucose-1-phosphate cytidylyltransferase [Actinobacteria bacterium]|nr:glucose-1-phosphate cytidylyltransferase [Actinomycetota bacterium]
MKAVLLAGGLGTRLREETEFRPKPMVEVGGRPILWHIMKNLSHYGITEFIVATGYKSDMIKEYFLNYEAWNNDFTVELGKRDSLTFHGSHEESAWTVTVAFTGETTMTGGRVHKVAKYLDGEPFLVAYGDGLADVNIDELREAHRLAGTLATVTTVQPTSRFGLMDMDPDGLVRRFREKPTMDGWVNIGFFVLESGALDYLHENSVLEQEPLARLAAEGQLSAFRHEGFWQPMDTYRELQLLNDLWDSGQAPWRPV